MYKAIIFDFDGVLVDTTRFYKYAIQNACSKKGLPFSQKIYSQYFSGNKTKIGFTQFLKSIDRLSELDECLRLRDQHNPNFSQEVKFFSDAIDFILRHSGKFQLCIGSGTQRILIDTMLKKVGLQTIFAHVVSVEHYVRGKPDPAVYNLVVSKLGMSKKSIIAIEDEELGIQAAKSAGLYCVAVTHTHTRKQLTQADQIIDSLFELKL